MKTLRDYRPLFKKLLVMFKKKYPRRVRNVLGLRYRVGFNDGVIGYITLITLDRPVKAGEIPIARIDGTEYKIRSEKSFEKLLNKVGSL